MLTILHIFYCSAMFSNPSLPTYGQEMVNPENAEAENYEALLNLAERLGEAKPRGLVKSGEKAVVRLPIR